MTIPGSRQVKATWDKTPETGMLELVLRIPVKPGSLDGLAHHAGWTEAQKQQIAQIVADSALNALHALERDGWSGVYTRQLIEERGGQVAADALRAQVRAAIPTNAFIKPQSAGRRDAYDLDEVTDRIMALFAAAPQADLAPATASPSNEANNFLALLDATEVRDELVRITDYPGGEVRHRLLRRHADGESCLWCALRQAVDFSDALYPDADAAPEPPCRCPALGQVFSAHVPGCPFGDWLLPTPEEAVADAAPERTLPSVEEDR